MENLASEMRVICTRVACSTLSVFLHLRFRGMCKIDINKQRIIFTKIFRCSLSVDSRVIPVLRGDSKHSFIKSMDSFMCRS